MITFVKIAIAIKVIMILKPLLNQQKNETHTNFNQRTYCYYSDYTRCNMGNNNDKFKNKK